MVDVLNSFSTSLTLWYFCSFSRLIVWAVHSTCFCFPLFGWFFGLVFWAAPPTFLWLSFFHRINRQSGSWSFQRASLLLTCFWWVETLFIFLLSLNTDFWRKSKQTIKIIGWYRISLRRGRGGGYTDLLFWSFCPENCFKSLKYRSERAAGSPAPDEVRQ